MNQIDIHNRKWIEAARSEHRALIDSKFFSSIIGESGTQPFVTVMGPTQGGKTTLILRLMGLEEDKFIKAYETIRAGRPEGSKSTPCPTIYRISNDNRYLIRVTHKDKEKSNKDKKNPCDEKEAHDTLCKYYEQGVFSANKILNISIPRDYFNIEGGFEPVLIDLPGFDGYGDDKKAVTEMYEEWITRANCVLLVAYAEHMSKLNELDNGDFPWVVRAWKELPHLFKIVLTAYSKNQTVINYWKSHKLSYESLNKQIKSILEDPARGIYDCPAWLWDSSNEGSVFAFDYGKYWFSLVEKDAHITKEIEPILDKHLCFLRKAIENSTDELSRIRSDCNLHSAFGLLKAKTEADIKDRREKLQGSREEIGQSRDKIDEDIEAVSNRMSVITRLMEDLKSSLKDKLEKEQSYQYQRDIKRRRNEIYNKCKNITDEGFSIIRELQTTLENTNNNDWKTKVKQDIDRIANILDPPFSIEQLLRRTYREFIFVTKRKTSDADDVIRKELDIWKTDIKDEIKKSVNNLTQLVDKDIKKLNKKEMVLIKGKKKVELEINSVDLRIAEIENDQKELEMEFNVATEKAEILPQLLRNHFQKHKSDTIKKVNATYSRRKQSEKQKDAINLNRICYLLSLQKGAMLLKQILGED